MDIHGCILNNMKVDMHSNNKVGEATLIHKKGSKVVGLHCNPVKLDLLLTCGNDHFDPLEFLVVIGRYISENYNGAALHPVDFIDISTGQLIAEVTEPNIITISPANKSIFIWRPREKSETVQPKDETEIVVCGMAEKKLNKNLRVKVMIPTTTFSQSRVRTPSLENLHQNHPVVVLRASDNLNIADLALQKQYLCMILLWFLLACQYCL
ncbi:protein DAMAGED DNA-BINDING 2-like isoform X2 [Actinidia eriantha]|uniref:protein DAMAGED DNA-BINDING 2-like isoform X2 n=1 Tax=Actinidia eriantha TaxID=165200 RepID=UPI0025843239|nr:protein DAMAGED DNA-BINDING 2-like isoform X2 [Actinidia eriantha]XP_057483371.1 protein DAMAGED DNA-BINDING 2-like isoform X2 [Actinidia eriantha]